MDVASNLLDLDVEVKYYFWNFDILSPSLRPFSSVKAIIAIQIPLFLIPSENIRSWITTSSGMSSIYVIIRGKRPISNFLQATVQIRKKRSERPGGLVLLEGVCVDYEAYARPLKLDPAFRLVMLFEQENGLR
ncbi:hypothetical protein V6N13_059314 [Hibiscus sabdariffa]